MAGILYLTSSYPYGPGEGFAEPEIVSFGKVCDVIVCPVNPKGVLKDVGRYDPKRVTFLGAPLITLSMVLIFLKFALLNVFKTLRLISDSIVWSSFKKSVRNIATLPKAVYLYETIIKSGEIDFIYSLWLSAPAQLALQVNKISGVKIGLSGHRYDLIESNNLEKKFRAANFVRLISNRSPLLLSEALRTEFSAKIKVVYMGVDIPEVLYFKLRPSELKIVCVASFLPVKGHAYLIDALAILRERGIKFQLDLFGDGILRGELVSQVNSLGLQESVSFMGNVDHDELTQSLAKNDYAICCLPSLDLGGGLHEGIPVSLMEAIAKGIPCVSTKTGSIPELIDHPKGGILVRDKSAVDLADAIDLLYSSESGWLSVRENAFANLINKFSSNKNNEIILKMIREDSEV